MGEKTVATERAGRRSPKAAEPDPDSASVRSAAGQAAQRVTSSSLFRGGRLLLIEHAGNEYRLQITSRGKLILTR